MIGIRTKVEGVPELTRRLRAISEKVCVKGLREAVSEVTKPILKDARAAVPVATKLLKKSLGRKVKTYRKNLVAVGVVGVRKQMKGPKGHKVRTDKFRRRVGTDRQGQALYQDPVKYAHLVEFGTKPHALGRGDRLARKGRRHAEVQTGRRHPGAKAHPFLRPALDRNKAGSKAIMQRSLKASLEKARRG